MSNIEVRLVNKKTVQLIFLQALNIKLSLQKPTKLKCKTIEALQHLKHTVQACIDRESMTTCVYLTDSVNEHGLQNQMANLQLVPMSGFLENIFVFLHFQLQLINIARHNQRCKSFFCNCATIET